MPANVVKTKADEKAWEAAKKSAANQGKGSNYAYIMSIFQAMTGKSKDLARAAKDKLNK